MKKCNIRFLDFLIILNKVDKEKPENRDLMFYTFKAYLTDCMSRNENGKEGFVCT